MSETMNELGRCKDCKHWRFLALASRVHPWGECAIAETTGPTKQDSAEASLAVALNSEDDNGGAWLCVHESYGCVQFVAEQLAKVLCRAA